MPHILETKIPKLLAIDDEVQSLDFIRDALSEERVELHTACDAAAAREAFQLVHPQIVLLDLVMPGNCWYNSSPRTQEPM